MTPQATEAMRIVRERWPGAKSFRWPSSKWEVFIGLSTLGSGSSEDQAWLNAVAGLDIQQESNNGS